VEHQGIGDRSKPIGAETQTRVALNDFRSLKKKLLCMGRAKEKSNTVARTCAT